MMGEEWCPAEYSLYTFPAHGHERATKAQSTQGAVIRDLYLRTGDSDAPPDLVPMHRDPPRIADIQVQRGKAHTHSPQPELSAIADAADGVLWISNRDMAPGVRVPREWRQLLGSADQLPSAADG